MSGAVNGLYPTRTRLALLRAIHSDPARVYLEDHVVWDLALGMRVTERVRELVKHGWVRALTPGEQRGSREQPNRTYYRIEPLGMQVLAEHRGSQA
jgi:hypothetical protein